MRMKTDPVSSLPSGRRNKSSNKSSDDLPKAPRHQRSSGAVRLEFRRCGERTRLQDLYQVGAMGARFPRSRTTDSEEAVLINKAGGLTGGDSIEVSVRVEPGADASITSQANEKIYRAESGAVTSLVALEVGEGASLVWLPQPTILFSGAHLDRHIEIDVEQGASMFLLESVILGRAAMGETFIVGRFQDHWRLRSNHGLIFAEEFDLDLTRENGASKTSTLKDGRAITTFLYVAGDAADRLGEFREALSQIRGESGASYRDGFIHGLSVAPTADSLMVDLATFAETFLGRPVPRVWTC